MKNILVPLDGSELAEGALPLAARLARASGGAIKLLEVIQPPADVVPAWVPGLEEAASGYLEEQAEKLRREENLSALVAVEFGLATAAIVAAVEAETTAIVMTSHGRTGLGLLAAGSVAESVVREASVPVFLIPKAALPAGRTTISRILVPLDGSDVAYSVMGPVQELAREFHARVTLLRVVPLPKHPLEAAVGTIPVDEAAGWAKKAALDELGPIQRHLASIGLRVDAQVAAGKPAERIVAVAEREGVDLIALATHARSGLDRLRHGSVAEEVLHHSHLPLMTFGRQGLRRLFEDISKTEQELHSERVTVEPELKLEQTEVQ